METTIREIVPRLPDAAPELEFVAFVNREAAPAGRELVGPAIEAAPIRVSGRSRTRRVIAEQAVLPRLARRHGINLLHSMGTTGPRFPRVVSVVTVHDVIYAIRPEAHSLPMRVGMRALAPLAVRGAERVLTVSNSSAGEISRVLGVPPDRIDIVHNAASSRPPTEQRADIRSAYDLGEGPLVLSVSARRPHKNLARLIEAFARLDPALGATLVLPGYPTPQDEKLAQLTRDLGIEGSVRFLGWVPRDDLDALYEAATCLVFPSLAEGFGLPVLEAMVRDLPVACSRASSLPEVGGEAPLYFADIAESIRRLVTDPDLRDRLRAAGRRRAAAFSWDRAARETVEAYRRAWQNARG
jgi:glycosyltransferase involved in cell wall biosynthesis